MFLKVPHVIKIIDIINIWVLLSLSRTQWCLLKILISLQSLIILISKFDSMMFLVCLLSSQSLIIIISKFYSIMFLVCLLSSQSLIILINEFYFLYKTLECVFCVPHILTIIDNINIWVLLCLWCVLRASCHHNHWFCHISRHWAHTGSCCTNHVRQIN